MCSVRLIVRRHIQVHDITFALVVAGQEDPSRIAGDGPRRMLRNVSQRVKRDASSVAGWVPVDRNAVRSAIKGDDADVRDAPVGVFARREIRHDLFGRRGCIDDWRCG